jgi:hypothetical protein
MGQSIAGQLNQLPIDMQGNVLGTNQPYAGNFRPAPGMPGVEIGYEDPYTLMTGQMPPAAGSPGAVIEQPFIPPGQGSPGMGGKSPNNSWNQTWRGVGEIMGDPANQKTLGATGTPEQMQQFQQAFNDLGSVGLGGKGGGGPLAQIPIDMNGNILGQGPNLPQTPPMMAPQTGTPGRPVPAEPFTPRGPGFANPGSGGVVPAPSPQVPGGSPIRPTLPTGRPMAAPPAPLVSQRSRVSRQPIQSMKMGRGAGRGGLLR